MNPSIPSSEPVDLFVIGAMKAATTAMCEWLAEQPGLAMSQPKEPAIFVSDEQAAAQLAVIDELYRDAADGDLRVDGSTDYAKFPSISGVPQRVLTHCPSARFVYMLRHPLERTISQYRFQWLLGEEKLPFEEALESNPSLVDNSRYAHQLQQWLDLFPSDRILLVTAESFSRDPRTEVRRVLSLLGLPVDVEPVSPLRERSNETSVHVLRSRRLRSLRRSPFGRAIRPLVPARVVDGYKRRVQQRSVPDIPVSVRESLSRTFDRDLADLSRITGGPVLTCASWHDTAATWQPHARPI